MPDWAISFYCNFLPALNDTGGQSYIYHEDGKMWVANRDTPMTNKYLYAAGSYLVP